MIFLVGKTGYGRSPDEFSCRHTVFKEQAPVASLTLPSAAGILFNADHGVFFGKRRKRN
jgi:hypothetical protein